MRTFIFLWLSFLMIPTAWAASPIILSHAVVALVPGQTTAAGYVTLKNTGPNDAVLTSITSACCASVEMHEMKMQGDIMRMRAITSMPIPAWKTAEFSPNENHVMFIGIKKTQLAGDKILSTLHFADGTSTPVEFTVQMRGH